MDLTPKQEAERLLSLFDKVVAKQITCEKIGLLAELNSVKMCQFHKEIDYYNDVLRELENL